MTNRELKIEDDQIDFIRLIMRSEDQGDGWRKISKMLRNFVSAMVERRQDLYETKEVDGVLQLRLSDRGSILADYV